MSVLKGTFPAMLTPYNSDKSVNEKEYMKLALFGLENGLDGLFCNGSAGDGLAIGVAQRVQLMKLSIEVANKKVPVITGIGSVCYEETLYLANEAKKTGCDALLLQPPFYYPMDEDTLITYFKFIASKVKLPLYLYNIPMFAPNMSLRVIQELSKEKNIVGMKDSSGSAVDLMHILDRCDFDVFVGREEYYAGALQAGVKGSMTSCGGVFPEIMSGIYKAYQAKDYERMYKFQKSIIKAIAFAQEVAFPLGYALLLEARGFKIANTSIHPISLKTLDALKFKKEEARNILAKISQEVGLASL
ncbi:dihydrodipicolinate synthase family protein [Helicobacter sp. 11S03491-1]|uniref:dihydrodipicolinate synthase family protein n=1 Tax=Helicobacter sp. 11S03491-1 TaxID=1476196 RepID=UPI000BA77562|nr:dihydrodipicolinate synthase family protein [Helicobacter sp. 11S03491-1]PAF42287.1 dihydrodipicolinate synthase family protein [Helicobacter sp. 11S03491-1]